MTGETLRRLLRWAVPLAAILVSLAASALVAQSTCKVDLGKGWAAGKRQGTIVMRNDGKPCGSPMYTVPQYNVPVDSITVVSKPRNGTVLLKVPQFLYTPNPGFSGQDRFELAAEGPDRERRQRIRLQGEVTVQVRP